MGCFGLAVPKDGAQGLIGRGEWFFSIAMRICLAFWSRGWRTGGSYMSRTHLLWQGYQKAQEAVTQEAARQEGITCQGLTCAAVPKKSAGQTRGGSKVGSSACGRCKVVLPMHASFCGSCGDKLEGSCKGGASSSARRC
jgi:hypothetical protein